MKIKFIKVKVIAVWLGLIALVGTTPACVTSSTSKKVESKHITREAAIEIANAKAIEFGYNLINLEVVCDDENSIWNWYSRKFPPGFFEEIERKLEGHQYWGVYYLPNQPDVLAPDLFVFVDRRDGTILAFLKGHKK